MGAPRRAAATAEDRRTIDDPPIADYINVSWGQAHRLQSRAVTPWAGAGDAPPPLYVFHGTAYSGRTFAPLMASLPMRRVAAIDTPGYGASTRPPEPWPLERYAEALLEAIDAAGEPEIDLLGYHTGALLAIEAAARRPDLIRRLILIGVPYLAAAAEREAWRARLAAPMRLTSELSQFEERWAFLVRDRAPGAPLAKGFDHFVDELRAWPFGFWAHEAAFTFAPEASLARVSQPTLVLNPGNALAAPSRAAAARIAGAQVIELPHLSHGVLDVAAAELAEHIEAFTSSPPWERTARG